MTHESKERIENLETQEPQELAEGHAEAVVGGLRLDDLSNQDDGSKPGIGSGSN